MKKNNNIFLFIKSILNKNPKKQTPQNQANISKKIFSWFLTLAFLFSSLWIINQAMAWLTDFNEAKYNKLVQDYQLSWTYSQEDYLNDFISWTKNWQLDTDAVSIRNTDISSITEITELENKKLELQWVISKIDTGFETLDTITTYMQNADCWDSWICTLDSIWWIWAVAIHFSDYWQYPLK